MRTRISVLLSLVVSVGLLGACGGANSGPASSSPQSNLTAPPVNEGKLFLRADIQGNTDVAGLRFTVERVACSPGESFEPVSEIQVRDVGALQLPGAIPAFENQPFDEDSEHLFADPYFFLPAGCYGVQSEPLKVAGARSDECRDASEEQIKINDDETTEIQPINQCQNEPRGGLDAVANVNHAPRLEDLAFSPFKVIQSCWSTQICATASDPDNDPLEFVWEKTSGGDRLEGPNVDSTTTNQDGSVTQCINVQPGQIGDFEFNVEVYDMSFNEQQNQVRIEELLAEQEAPGDTDPRDMLDFPVYSGKKRPA